jgi:hypothetical protein
MIRHLNTAGARLAPALLALQLAACGTLPTQQSAGFKTLASGSQVAFAALSGAQAEALANEQLALVAKGEKRLRLSPGCTAVESSTDPCFVVVGDLGADNPAADISLGAQTAHMQKLLLGISQYAGAMSDLAAAKDLDKAAAATGRVTAGLKSLAATVYPPGGAMAGPVLEAFAFGAAQMRLQQRRATMLRLAARADPIVRDAADALSQESARLRLTLLRIRKERLSDAKLALDAYDAKPAADPDKAVAARAKLAADVAAAASAVDRARAIRTDFTPLARAHQLLLAALRDPNADPTAGVAEAQAFQDALKPMTALGPAPPADASSAAKSPDAKSDTKTDGKSGGTESDDGGQ